MGKKKSIELSVPNKLSAFYKRYIRIVPEIKSYVLAAIFVFVLGMVITTLSWYVDRQRVATLRDTEISAQANAVEVSIKNRLTIYEQIIKGVGGLYTVAGPLTSAELHNYVEQYNVGENYPGMQALGYVERVTPDGIPAYQERMRALGYDGVVVSPAGDRPEYALMSMLEPFGPTSRNYLGFDVLTDATRAELANRARDTGEVGISEKTSLLSDSRNNQKVPGFVMYGAFYDQGVILDSVEDRREHLRGYIYAGYRASNFFNRAIDRASFTAYKDIQVFDGPSTDAQDILYETANFNDYGTNDISQNFEMSVFGQTWTVRFAGPLNAATEDGQRSNMILIGGATISFAIAGFLFLVMLTRARAIVYAKQNEAQQAKDDLLSLASHQLRTPATAVKQYLGMILEGYTGRINKKQLPALQKAYASNERQLDTINQILYVAKADAGRLSINKDSFDINMLIDGVVLDLSDSLEQNDQTIVVNRSSKKLMVNGDEASLRMVVENLISNACKYSYQGSKITVETGLKNDEIFIAIADEGVGIAPDDYDKLFKKFSRIDNDLSLQVGGSGIGLYIDKVLVELHGGRIAVSSEVNRGSTFTVYLPKQGANNLTDGDG